jgi:hypothetical protein
MRVNRLLACTVPGSLAKSIHRTESGQAPKQCAPVLHVLVTRHLQGGEECLLEGFERNYGDV